MYQINVNNNTLKTEIKINGNTLIGTINDLPFQVEFNQVHTYEYFIKYKNTSYSVIVNKIIPEEKKLVLKINGKKTTVEIKDRFDLLLHQLGMDKMAAKKIDSVKAPMPGMILNVLVNEGQAIKKGDTLLILEAMKMENALKAAADGVIKKIAVEKGTAVEKNQLLIEL